MDPASPARRPGLGRRLLKWGAIGVLLVIFAIAGLVVYFQSAEIPQSILTRLQQQAQARGFTIQFSSARLRGWRSITARDVQATWTNGQGRASVRIKALELSFNAEDLKSLRFRPHRLKMEGAQLIWPVVSSNGPASVLSVTDIAAVIRSANTNQWHVESLAGHCLGTEVHVTADLTNVAELRNWPWPKRPAGKPPVQEKLARWLEQAQELKLGAPSVLVAKLSVDGRDSQSGRAQLSWRVPQAVWRDQTVQQLLLRAQAAAQPGTAGDSKVNFELQLDRAARPGLQLQPLRLAGELAGSSTELKLQSLSWKLQLAGFQAQSVTGADLLASGRTRLTTGSSAGPMETELSVDTGKLESAWGTSASNHVAAEVAHGRTLSDPWQARWSLIGLEPISRWGQAARVQLSGSVAPRAGPLSQELTNADLRVWAKLAPFELDWQSELDQLRSTNLVAAKVSLKGSWRTPQIVLPELHAELYGHTLDASASLNATNRAVQAQANFDFDVHQIEGLLTPGARKWLGQFTWTVPPRVTAELQLRLPNWTNTHPNWREEVMPTIALTGQFAATNGTFRKVGVSQASAHFTLTNLTWHLPDLQVQHADGQARLDYSGHMGTHDYHWVVDVRANPKAFKPMFELELENRIVDQFDFPNPPAVQGEVWGRWHDPESVRFWAAVAATNFLFRGERCSRFNGHLNLKSGSLGFTNVVVAQDAQEITVPAGSFDLIERVVYLTNAVSTMDPDLVTRVIGPKVRAALAPYRFPVAPAVRANGRLPTLDIADADVRFEVAGDQMQYWKFNLTNVSGTLFWRGENLSITNLHAGFYGGAFRGHGDFDFSVPVGARLAFQSQFKDADFHALMADILPRTNRLEGSLAAQVTITSANSDDWRSWQGSGQLRLQDGFLWDIPIFGVFSPVLNTLVPGLGNSRVSAGEAHFRIDESVVRTSDLELRSPALRLAYNGSVDFKGNVDARVHADILRDAWGVGRLLSWAFWPISKVFEYQITGTVSHPNSEPVFIPRALMWPFHPFRAMRKLFSPDKPRKTENPFADGLAPFPSTPGLQHSGSPSADEQEHAQPERDAVPAEADEAMGLDKTEKPAHNDK